LILDKILSLNVTVILALRVLQWLIYPYNSLLRLSAGLLKVERLIVSGENRDKTLNQITQGQFSSESFFTLKFMTG
jgi:hypothetical protein